ncbi:unnamed protein product [Darwinula stevensoni]|uniref:Uncharacterized protein n=1 Tax=Darwinula stevensoni TaxID=69355 RepID=A0A7R8X7L6_9CRUS|nr:unnamed protein product [Darwinula stevensoni]CAG0889226.1 unnamed protein product [Darwinula stevensoni]
MFTEEGNVESLSVQVFGSSARYLIRKRVQHPEYREETLANDLEMIILEMPVELNTGACILCTQDSQGLQDFSQCKLISHMKGSGFWKKNLQFGYILVGWLRNVWMTTVEHICSLSGYLMVFTAKQQELNSLFCRHVRDAVSSCKDKRKNAVQGQHLSISAYSHLATDLWATLYKYKISQVYGINDKC